MIKDERHFKILNYLKEHQFANVKQLAELLACSEITIRRDINELDKKNQLLKVHGGAQVRDDHLERIDIDFKQRTILYPKEKKVIAQLAATLITHNQSIYLDAGTNVQLLIPYLKNHNVKVYTHGVHHLIELSKHSIDCHLIGGEIKWSTLATIGALSIEEIGRFHYDIAFLGANALDDDFGYSTPDEHEAAIKQQIIKSSQEAYVLCDSSKFNKKSNIRFAKHEDVTLITDENPQGFKNITSVIYPKMKEN